eukprot:jgi/Ulvmu1/6832/UM031_0036.1
MRASDTHTNTDYMAAWTHPGSTAVAKKKREKHGRSQNVHVHPKRTPVRNDASPWLWLAQRQVLQYVLQTALHHPISQPSAIQQMVLPCQLPGHVPQRGSLHDAAVITTVYRQRRCTYSE